MISSIKKSGLALLAVGLVATSNVNANPFTEKIEHGVINTVFNPVVMKIANYISDAGKPCIDASGEQIKLDTEGYDLYSNQPGYDKAPLKLNELTDKQVYTIAGLFWGTIIATAAGLTTGIILAIKKHNKDKAAEKLKVEVKNILTNAEANTENLSPELQAIFTFYKNASDEEKEIAVNQLTQIIVKNPSLIEELQASATTTAATN